MAIGIFNLLNGFGALFIIYRVVIWLLYPGGHRPVTKKDLQHIPELRFKENDTYERYIHDTRALLTQGYNKYLKNGVPFQMHNPILELGPQVMMPMKYLDEIKSAPMSLFSFKEFSVKTFLLHYIDAPLQTDASAHVIKVDLNRNLNNSVNGIWTEVIAALDEAVPQSGEWKTFDTYSLLTTVSARATAYAIVGPELARNPEWIKLAVEATMTIFGASNAIRDAYAPHWRWLAKYRSEAPKRVRELRAKAKELIAPVYATRLEAFKKDGCDDLGDDITGKFVDTIYWLLGNKGAEKSLSAIADQEVFLTITSVHTTSGTMHSVLFDWLAHPEIHEDIRAECRDVLLEATDANGRVRWTTQLLAKLRKLDSFMKESARMHPIGFITAQRYTQKNHTFKDGLFLPKGTIFQFPLDGVHYDPDIYDHPHTFDAYRFLRMRETVDPNRFHFASVTDESLNFGTGQHSCPGRFLSTIDIKLVLLLLMTRYEVRFEDETITERPADMSHDFNLRANPMTKIKLRRL